MAYTKQTWADLPSKTTPINAERLTHIEDGIFNAAQTADTAASTAGTAAANVGIVSGRVETLTERVNGLDTAVSNKVDKVAGKGLSTNDYDNTDKGKVDSLGTASTKNSTSVVTDSTDLVESGAVFDAIKGSVGFVTTGKNLFDGKATSKTDQYGVTWTVDPTDNNVATVSGTPTGVEAFRQFSDKVLPTGIYKFYGLSDTTNIAFNALVLYQDNTVIRVITAITEGGEFEILSSDVYNRIGIEYKRDVNGTPCSGTIRTMITKSTVTNTTYEPYHASVDESKADNSVIGTVEDGTTASQAYAVGSHFIRDDAFCTVAQAISSGGTLTEGTNYTSGSIADVIGFIKEVRIGTFNFSTNNGFATKNINFSIPFSNNIDEGRVAVFVEVVSGNSSNVFASSVVNSSKTGFTVQILNAASAQESSERVCFYLAIAF